MTQDAPEFCAICHTFRVRIRGQILILSPVRQWPFSGAACAAGIGADSVRCSARTHGVSRQSCRPRPGCWCALRQSTRGAAGGDGERAAGRAHTLAGLGAAVPCPFRCLAIPDQSRSPAAGAAIRPSHRDLSVWPERHLMLELTVPPQHAGVRSSRPAPASAENGSAAAGRAAAE